MTVFACIVAVLLGAFTVRRYLFWVGSLLPRRAIKPSRTRSIALLVAARDEAAGLPHLLAALDAADYPPALLNVVLVSDGSTDPTPSIIERWAARSPRTQAIALPEAGGKGAALQTALAAAPKSELVMVLDADTAPAPDALAWLAGAFADPRVGGACGYPDPGRQQTSPPARYAALERWVSHLVTWAGKDRLWLQPPVIGAFCAVRTEALAQIGGFSVGSAAEDIDLSLALTQAGWRTRWIGEAAVREDVPDTFSDFRRQRLRWSRGLLSNWHKARSVEDMFAMTGYLDRLVFVAGLGLSLSGRLPLWLPLAYAAAPVVVMLTALRRARVPDWPAYLWSLVPMTFFDIAITLESAVAQAMRRPIRWKDR